MKQSRRLVLLAVALVLLGQGVRAGPEQSKTATLDVQGMTCGACTASVKIVLKKLDGVSDAKVSFDEGRAVVTYDPAKLTPQKMADTINAKLPYKAKVVADPPKKP